MAAKILTDNDIRSLAQIFDTALQYYCKHTSPSEDDYIKKLSTIVGLGFTAVLVDGDLLAVYEPYLQEFIRYRNFKKYQGYTAILSRAVAKMIEGGVLFSDIMKHLECYDVFATAVKKSTAAHVMVHVAGKTEEAERLMQVLFQKRY